MSTILPVPLSGLVFPDSDGQSVAENTRQWEAIVTLQENREAFAPADAFVAGDHLIDTTAEMQAKRRFYFHSGAEEYYEFDPEAGNWLGSFLNAETGLPDQINQMDGHVSPRLGMCFAFRPRNLLLVRTDGSRFLLLPEFNDRLAAKRERAEQEKKRAEQQQEHDRLRRLLRHASIGPARPAE
jgi:hypothetical protein